MKSFQQFLENMDQDHLIQAIVNDPADKVSISAYADWLEENGEEEAADVLRQNRYCIINEYWHGVYVSYGNPVYGDLSDIAVLLKKYDNKWVSSQLNISTINRLRLPKPISDLIARFADTK